jgi:hypothetical protein
VLPDQISEALPQGHGFIRSYVEYASACSDAPEIYHVGTGLTVFAAAVAKKLPCPWTAGRVLLPNLYTLLVGTSRSSRKTSSMDSGIDLVHTADPERVMPIPGSYEELLAQLRKKPEGLLTYREFGHFLKTTQRGYGEPIRTVLMDLFDWPPDRNYTRNLKKGATVIEAPICLSMLSSISTDLLFAYADSEEWTGGFFGRMVVLFGERDQFKMPVTWPAAHQQLAAVLHSFIHYPFPRCGGFSPQAWAAFEHWSRFRDSQASSVPPRVQTFVAGATTLAAKVALLYAADAAEPLAGTGWLVSYETMRRAILFVENLYFPSIWHLGERLTLGLWERDRQRVLDAVEAYPNGVTRRDLLRRAKLSSEYLDSVVNTLKEEGSIVQGQDSRGIVYKKSADGLGQILKLPTPQGQGSGSGTPPTP